MANTANTAFTLVATDASGRQAVSNSLRVQNPIFNCTMCVDKQNSIINFTDEAGDGILYQGWIAGYDTGAVFAPVPEREIAPAGEDATWPALSSIEAGPRLHTADSTPEAMSPTRRLVRCDERQIVFDNLYDEPFARARVRFTLPRPTMRGVNTLRVDSHVELKQDVLTLAQDGFGTVLFRALANAGIARYPRWTSRDADGRTWDGTFPDGTSDGFRAVLTDTDFRDGAALGLYPHRAGRVVLTAHSRQPRLAAIGLSTSELHAFVRGTRKYRECLMVGLPPGPLKAGQVITTRLQLHVDSGQQQTSPLE